MAQLDFGYADDQIEAIATKITQGIYSAPLSQATERQRGLALTIAANIAAIAATAEAASAQRYRLGLIAIQHACRDGKVCDDVAWFDGNTTLHDYIEELLSPSAPAAIADLFEESAA